MDYKRIQGAPQLTTKSRANIEGVILQKCVRIVTHDYRVKFI